MRTQDFQFCNTGSSPVQITRFVGVKVNITDCRSVTMGSSPVQTADDNCSISVGGCVSVFQTGGESSNHSCCSLMPDSVTGNTPESESGILSSNLSPVSG